jgi:hypothetical protein
VFAVLHSANTECTAAWLLKPDADIIRQACSPSTSGCSDMQVQNLQALRIGNMCRQEPRDRLDLDCMHTGIDKAWSTQRAASMLATRRTVQQRSEDS